MFEPGVYSPTQPTPKQTKQTTATYTYSLIFLQLGSWGAIISEETPPPPPTPVTRLVFGYYFT